MSDSELGTRRGAATARVIRRRRTLPGGRAALGALLVAIAAVGVFAAYASASDGPSDRIVIASRDIDVGAVIEADDVQIIRGELPSGTRHATFASVHAVVGHVALGPIGHGEILQAGSITDDTPSVLGHEIALTLPRDQIAVGHLQPGDLVDVFVTRDDETSAVAVSATVVRFGSDSDQSLTSRRELTIVVAVPSGEVVVALVHALRTGEVTVVRSTFAASVDRGGA